MTAPVSNATPVQQLVALADELGYDLNRHTARSMCERLGFKTASDRLARSIALIDLAARDLGVRIDLPIASRRLAVVGFDVAAALARLR